MLTKPFKPLALAFLVNLIISVEDKIKYKSIKTLTKTINVTEYENDASVLEYPNHVAEISAPTQVISRNTSTPKRTEKKPEPKPRLVAYGASNYNLVRKC